jgi:predicted regulator of Ras-like GTPase activity (Roadblock/LC7/MglB family)
MTTNSVPATNNHLDDLLSRLVNQVAYVRCAVLVSDDGLVVSKSHTLLRADAECLGA